MNARITTAGQAIPGRLFRIMESHGMTLFIAVACVFFSLSGTISDWATWYRVHPLGIELWSSHFVHWSGGHLFWDLLMFTTMAACIEAVDRRLLTRILVVSPPLIIASTWIMENHAVYRGLSGLDCSLYAALVVVALKKSWVSRFMAILLLCLFVGKSIYEICTGGTIFVSDLPSGITGVPWAHLSGAVSGMVIALMKRIEPAN